MHEIVDDCNLGKGVVLGVVCAAMIALGLVVGHYLWPSGESTTTDTDTLYGVISVVDGESEPVELLVAEETPNGPGEHLFVTISQACLKARPAKSHPALYCFFIQLDDGRCLWLNTVPLK